MIATKFYTNRGHNKFDLLPLQPFYNFKVNEVNHQALVTKLFIVEILMATLQTLASRLFISIFWLTVIPITIWILDYFLAFYIQQLQFFGH